MPSFFEKSRDLAARVAGNNVWRQRECFNLIPSESTPSLLVKMCEISDPSGRYAEHRTMKGEEVYFYQGTDFIRDVEVEARTELAKFFNCGEVELRPISGQMANEVVFKGMVKFINRDRAEGTPSRRMRLVMNNDLTKGGHLSSQPMGALFNFVEEDPATGKERVVHFPVLPDNPYKPDLPKLAEILHDHRPELIVFGKSMFIYQEPVRFVADIVKDWPREARADVRHGPRPRPLRRLPGAARRGRRHRHREHPQDVLRAPARARRRQLPPGDAAPEPVARTSRPGPSPARPRTTTSGRCSACSWPPTR